MKGKYRYSIRKEEDNTGSRRTLFCALASLAALACGIVISFVKRGAGPAYVGALGLCSMILAAFGLFSGLQQLKGENRGRRNPLTGTLLCGVVFIVWLVLIIAGIK